MDPIQELMELTSQVGHNSGKIEELERRLDKISDRVDAHISSCTIRFIGLLSAIAIGVAIITALIPGKL